jgi:PAS domain S-box-containing protein
MLQVYRMPFEKKQSLGGAHKEILDSISAHEEKVSTEEKLTDALTINGTKQTGQFLTAENSQEGIVMGDLWGYITDVNDVIVKLYGAKDKSEFIGKHLLNFVSKEERGRLTKMSFDSITNDRGWTEKCRVVSKSGQELSIEVRVEYIRDKQGEKIGFIDYIKIIS